ncbi:PREDICTED: la-related protein 1A-like [Nelumbo nucifera]|uniref:La-related protein 1A-like n=1 Tax=Nelumbo nucifera TaxID=4432 RepID=A0A1U8Q0A2_NELNU|nr:PREDICTED: la-related protein 1A-like [Nelumbo nucifera]
MVTEFLDINAGPVSTDIDYATVSSSDKESSSCVNFKLSASIDASDQNVTSLPSSTKSSCPTPASVNSLRPFNHHNNRYPYHSSPMGFYHNQRGNKSHWFLSPPPPPPLWHSFPPPIAIVNPPYVNVLPPSPPPFPGCMPPYGYYNNGYCSLTDAYYGPLVGPPPAPFMEAVNGGPPPYPQEPSPLHGFPHHEFELCTKIQNRIEYYFSEQNLVDDFYLRGKMAYEGWVPIDLIAGFRRIKALTSDVDMIVRSLKISTTVEVKDNHVCKR